MRYRSTTTFMLCALAFLSSTELAAAPLSILWDDAHDGTEIPPLDELSDLYSEFAAFIMAAGHSILEHEVTDGPLSATVLASHDVLMVFDAENPFTTAEIGAIQSFVSGGGLLFVAGDRPGVFNRTSNNALLTPYGVTFSLVDLLDGLNTNPAFDLTVFPGDPLTAGVTVIDFLSSGTLSVNLAGTAAGATKVLGRTAAPASHIGYAYGANGRVVVMSDADPWSNLGLDPSAPGDEETLLANLLAHFDALAQPTPTPTSSPTPLPPEPTATPTETATPQPTDTPTPQPTETPAPPTATATPLPTETPTPFPTETPTLAPTETAIPTATHTPLPTPTHTPLPTETHTPLPTATPTPMPPTATATAQPPTATPTPLPPTATPTLPPPTPTPTVGPLVVKIDIRPGVIPNPINLNSSGNIPVAILTTSTLDGEPIDFDPWDEIDRSTIKFGPAFARPHTEPSAQDVDADGDIDMLLHFKTQLTGITCGLTQTGIKAKNYGGRWVIGVDTIVVTGCS